MGILMDILRKAWLQVWALRICGCRAYVSLRHHRFLGLGVQVGVLGLRSFWFHSIFTGYGGVQDWRSRRPRFLHKAGVAASCRLHLRTQTGQAKKPIPWQLTAAWSAWEFWVEEGLGVKLQSGCIGTQRAQYPLIKQYTLNYKGLQILIYAIFLRGIGLSGDPDVST